MAFFQDLNNNNPKTQPGIVDVVAVGQWVNDFINTRKKTRLFNLDYGPDLEDSLFDIIDTQNALIIFAQLSIQLETAIPIVKVNAANSTVTPLPDSNQYAVNVVYNIIGVSGNQFSAKVTLGGSNV